MVVKSSPKVLTGSPGARRMCALLLEALAGLRSTMEVAEALSVTQPRYYQLKARALQGMIDALEPKKRGRQKSIEDALVESEKDRKRMHRDLARTIHGVATPVVSLAPEVFSERTGSVKWEVPVWPRRTLAFPPGLPDFRHAQYRPMASMKSE